MPRPFRFAVTARFARTGTKWRDVARRAEDLGYDVMLVTDHMGPQLAPIPALMAAADATTRLRVGSFVFANDYRNPVMLAKEVATIDVLSGGRVEVGIGAGWKTGDYRELGIRYDAPAVRVSRLEESVILLKRLLTEEHVDHTGDHYTVRGAQILPRPLQRPHPPLMIGGGGPRVLRLAARQADIVLPSASAYEKNGTVTNVCGEVQRLKQAIKVMGTKTDLEIFGQIAKEMGLNLGIWLPDKVFDEIRKSVHGYGVSPALLAMGPVATMPLNGRVAALPGAIQSSGDTLFTSGSLTPYSEILNKVMEAPGQLYGGQGQ